MFKLQLENDRKNIVDIHDGRRYVVTDVSGLNPPSASLFLSKSPNRKGVKHNGSSLNERNIAITITILGDVEANRNHLYDWINTEQYVKIYYSNGVKNVYCEGHIEECEIDFFTNNEVINLAIVCEDPYWKDLLEISNDISYLLKGFTFPFSIDFSEEVKVEGETQVDGDTPHVIKSSWYMNKGIPFSTYKESTTTEIFNTGNETGAIFTIKCLKDTEDVVLLNANNANERFEIKTKLKKDEIVIIDTDSSPKTVKLYRPDGSVDNILRYTGYNTTWFTIKKGHNAFGYDVGNGDLTDIEVSVRYSNKYLGV